MKRTLSLLKLGFQEKSAPLPSIASVILGTLFISLAAQISVSISAVPFTFQNFAVILTAALLGSKRGFLCAALYLLEGALGAPVFACGKGSIICLLGPTAGYLWSYPIVAFGVGWIVERARSPRWLGLNALTAALLGHALVLLLGWQWLALIIGSGPAWSLGVYPFMFIDLFKAIAVSFLMLDLRKV